MIIVLYSVTQVINYESNSEVQAITLTHFLCLCRKFN